MPRTPRKQPTNAPSSPPPALSLNLYSITAAVARFEQIGGRPISVRHFSLLAKKHGVGRTLPQILRAFRVVFHSPDDSRAWLEQEIQALVRLRGVGRTRRPRQPQQAKQAQQAEQAG
jgi:hypothetical protein